MKFHTTLSGPDQIAIVKALDQLDLLPRTQPTFVRVDHEPYDLGPSWLDEALALGTSRYTHFAFPGDELLVVWPRKVVILRLADFEVDPPRLCELFSPVPFELASLGPLHQRWGDPFNPDGPRPLCGFGHGHGMHGWGCMIRGAGHDQLVSRRWLEHGPFRLIKGPNDTSLVQLHDLDADAITAAAQAGPGIGWIGQHWHGGFIQHTLPLPKQAPGSYVHETRELVISIYGREVPAQEMLIARAIQALGALGEDKPIARVVFSFADAGEARAHLHDLWLRGLVCETFVGGDKTRLTDDYDAAPPAKPAWVAELDG